MTRRKGVRKIFSAHWTRVSSFVSGNKGVRKIFSAPQARISSSARSTEGGYPKNHPDTFFSLHLLDDQVDWEQRLAVTQLLDRASREKNVQTLAALDPRVARLDWFNGRQVTYLSARFGAGFLAAPALSRYLDVHNINVIHAWGMPAASAAAAARSEHRSLIVHRFDPHVTDQTAKLLRTIAQCTRFAVACAGGTVRRRLIEKGVPADACVVIRPGVDFQRISAAKKKRDSVRDALGLAADHRLILAAHPVVARTGHERIVWSAVLQHHTDPNFRYVVFGDNPQCQRLKRLTDRLHDRDALIWPGNTHHYEDLIAVADALVITPFDDVATTSIAWAMAACVPVVGSAVYAVAELISHKHNGLLIKPQRSPRMSVEIAAAVFKIDDLAKEKEVARGQAYEIFSVRRYIDQLQTLQQNLAADIPPATNITDSAAL